jgi:hypothetical protein
MCYVTPIASIAPPLALSGCLRPVRCGGMHGQACFFALLLGLQGIPEQQLRTAQEKEKQRMMMIRCVHCTSNSFAVYMCHI